MRHVDLMRGPSRRYERHGSWTLFLPVAFAGTVWIARLVGDRDVPPRGAGLLVLGILSGVLLVAAMMRRRVLDVDELGGTVTVRLVGRHAERGYVEHQAPAWAVAVERKLDASRPWRGVPALRFPDGARVRVSREDADRVRRLRLETSRHPRRDGDGAAAVFVTGRESVLLAQAHRASLVLLAASLLYVGLGISLGAPEPAALRHARDLGLFLLAFVAVATGVARHFRPQARILGGRVVEVTTMLLGVPLVPGRQVPYLEAVPDPRRRVLAVAPSLVLRFPQFPHGDPLAAAGAEALAEAARKLRTRLEPVLALAREDAGAALYREPADMRNAATRAALVAPGAVLELQRTPRAILRLLRAGLSGPEATLIRTLRAVRA